MFVFKIGVAARLSVFAAACLLVSGCDGESREIECGNGVIEAGEGCDGTAMPQKSCRDFGFSGGTLGCSSCALVMTGCTKCGDSYIDSGEQCDRENLGDKTCADVGYFGGELACSSDCTFDTGGCLDCGGADPCAGATCSGHGTCRLEACEPWCECEAGYLPGYNLTCRQEGSCLGLGEECRYPLDCCLGSCFKLGYDITGRCGMLGCVDDAHCASLAPEGTTMCCMEYYDLTACQAVAAGLTCGDRSGACGASCSGQFQSACAPGLACVSAGFDDQLAVCANPCSSDADCLECADPVNPDREFECAITADGRRYCMTAPTECERHQDCPEGLFCGVRDNETMTGLEGNCLRAGALDTGEPCTYLYNLSADRPHEQICASEYCWFGYCSELCLTDADCPEDMYCALMVGLGRSRMELMPFCLRMEGSGTPCSINADCPSGESCAVYELTHEGDFNKVCKTASCDPAQPDCLGPGETCGTGLPPCWDGLCADFGTAQLCTAYCEDSSPCPRGTACSTFTLPEDIEYGVCYPFDGSGDACSSDADCTEDGEVCAHHTTRAGRETLCSSPLGDGQIGEPCSATAPCANGICLSNGIITFCSAPCLVDADCPDSYMCHTIYDPNGENFPACAPFAGSQDPCTGDQDCTAVGEMCLPVYPWEQPKEGRCVEGNPGGASSGEACTSDGNCLNGQCPPELGYCSAYCFTNPDCAIYGMECKAFREGYFDAISICIIPDADSPLCTLCATDADCDGADARCIESLANPGEKYCGKPCAGAADCPVDHSCVDVGGVNNCKPDTDTCIP